MPQTVTDELWKQRKDGTMERISSTPRVVSDDDLALLTAREVLGELARKPTLTNLEMQQAIRLLIRLVAT